MSAKIIKAGTPPMALASVIGCPAPIAKSHIKRQRGVRRRGG
jgi:hypothetical protein